MCFKFQDVKPENPVCNCEVKSTAGSIRRFDLYIPY